MHPDELSQLNKKLISQMNKVPQFSVVAAGSAITENFILFKGR